MTDREKEEENQLFESLLEQEVDRSHMKLSRYQKDIFIKNAKLAIRIEKEINRTFPDMPGQRLAIAQSILHNTVKGYLDEASKLEEAKKHIKLSVMAQIARIMAMISVYPDMVKYEGFRNLSHDQLRQLFDEEYKKLLT